MKTLFTTFLLLIFFGFFGFSQNAEIEPQSLFSSGSKLTGWFVGIQNTNTILNGKTSYMPGFAAGVVMNRNFKVGIAAKSLSWYPEYMRYDNLFEESVYLEGGFAGLYAEASTFENKLIHLSFPVIIGGGECKYRSVKEYQEIEDEGEIDYSHKTLSRSPFYVFEPGVNLELNVTGFLRVYAGYSYRWMPGLNLSGTNHNAFNYSNFNIGVKIGKF